MFLPLEIARDCVLELDADSLVYRIGGAVDMLGEGKQFAERAIDQAIQNMMDDTNCISINIYLGTSANYRNEIATIKEYKGNRKNKERPQYYDAIRAHLVSEYGAKLCYGQEAEDAVGIAATKYKNYEDFIIGAIDKDMKMIPGNHYNYVTRKIEFIDKIQALRNFYTQLVTGDSTDNIPGVYHLLLEYEEEEKAHKFRYSRYKTRLIEELNKLETEMEMYRAAKSVYESQFGPLTISLCCAIIEIARLLWIRRYQGEIWELPSERTFNYIDNDRR